MPKNVHVGRIFASIAIYILFHISWAHFIVRVLHLPIARYNEHLAAVNYKIVVLLDEGWLNLCSFLKNRVLF